MSKGKKLAVPVGQERPKRLYGFQNLTPERVREIAALGGREAHRRGVAHEFTSEEAKVAGSKGGRKKRDNHAARKKEA